MNRNILEITDIQIFSYRLPLVKMLDMKGRQQSYRSGLVIGLKDEAGYIGYGEISPFPGLHQETLADAREQILQKKALLIKKKLIPELGQLQGGFEKWFAQEHLFPSVRYGMEMAVLNLLADQYQQPFAGLLSAEYRSMISLNGLISSSREEMPEQLQLLLKEGYTAIKLKVGQQALAEDIDMVRNASAALPDSASLRLDANRSWSLATAITFAKAVEDCAIEYLEEPLANPAELAQFYHETACPLALDESLSEVINAETIKSTRLDEFQPPTGVSAFILKPAVLGGFEQAMQWARLARGYHIKSVVSSVFESGLGLSALVNFAACLNEKDVPAGLATFKWFKEDILMQKISPIGNRLDVKDIYDHSKALKKQLLNRIS